MAALPDAWNAAVQHHHHQHLLPQAGAGPIRHGSLNFLDLVDELAAVPELAETQQQREEQREEESSHPSAVESCSGLSSNMDFEQVQGTAESRQQAAAAAVAAAGGTPLSWTSGESVAFAAAVRSRGAAAVPLSEALYPGAPVEASVASCMLPEPLFPSAMADEEVASMVFSGVAEHHRAKLEQSEALDEFLRRGLPDAVEGFPAPVLGGFDSRDSVHSAPGLAPHGSFSSGAPPAASASGMGRCHSVEVSQKHLQGDLHGLLARSYSSITPGVKRTYSAAGPGTNRPPKEGSQSALLPKDKLQRKRAAARRYYHNQKNKAVDYEVTISNLETENHALSRELMNALKQLEMLKKAKSAVPAPRTAIC